MTLLDVDGLTVRYGRETVIDNLSFTVQAGDSVGLVGESGSGKTQTALAILGLLSNASVSGSILVNGQQVVGASEAELNRLRARRVSIVFQDPMLALNPYRAVGKQLRDILTAHGVRDSREARARATSMLERVGLPDPERQYRAFPHQLSGGMRQRVMIASALITSPDLVIADEPTTSLDVTVQAQILELLETIRDETALLLITHDLGVVAGACERIIVLDRGAKVEEGPTRTLFSSPASERMRRLLEAAPRLDRGSARTASAGKAILKVVDANVRYREREQARELHAVRGVTMDVAPGETLAIVGESGSGKSSLVRGALGLVRFVSGDVTYRGETLARGVADRPLAVKRELSLVFQDPVQSLDPQMRVDAIVMEPLSLHRADLTHAERRERVLEILDRVGLNDDYLARYPHQLSGGEAQRVAIARALITGPGVLVCDEAVAALDGSVRERVLELLSEIQAETGLAVIFIAHDLAVVRSIAHRVLVMYLGQHVELASAAALFSQPRHPYTRALIDAVPAPDPVAIRSGPLLAGEPPSPLNPPPGCGFEPRCPHAHARCAVERPHVRAVGGSRVACHRADELDLRPQELHDSSRSAHRPGERDR